MTYKCLGPCYQRLHMQYYCTKCFSYIAAPPPPNSYPNKPIFAFCRRQKNQFSCRASEHPWLIMAPPPLYIYFMARILTPLAQWNCIGSSVRVASTSTETRFHNNSQQVFHSLLQESEFLLSLCLRSKIRVCIDIPILILHRLLWGD